MLELVIHESARQGRRPVVSDAVDAAGRERRTTARLKTRIDLDCVADPDLGRRSAVIDAQSARDSDAALPGRSCPSSGSSPATTCARGRRSRARRRLDDTFDESP